MGQTADVEIFYGYVWKEEGEGPFAHLNEDSDRDGWSYLYAWFKKNYPNLEYSSDEGRALREAKEVEVGFDVWEFGGYGYIDYPYNSLYVKSTRRASSWEAINISEVDFSVNENIASEWQEALARLVEATGAKIEDSGAEGPAWFAAPSYG